MKSDKEKPLMDEETLRRYWQSSPKAKLEWLEEAHQLTQKVMTPQKLKIREKIRNSKLKNGKLTDQIR